MIQNSGNQGNFSASTIRCFPLNYKTKRKTCGNTWIIRLKQNMRHLGKLMQVGASVLKNIQCTSLKKPCKLKAAKVNKTRRYCIMTLEADVQIKELAREIIAGAGMPYTPEQLAEIPSILAAKSRYFWCIDNQEKAFRLSGAAAPETRIGINRWSRTAVPADLTWCLCTLATTRSCALPARTASSC